MEDIENPVITGIENDKTYCAEVGFEASDNDGNRYFMEHTQVGDTKYELLDISMKSPKEVADDVINWVHGKVFV